MAPRILLIAALAATCLAGCDRDPYYHIPTAQQYYDYLTHDDQGRSTIGGGWSQSPMMLQRSFTDCSSHVYLGSFETSCETW